MPAKLYLTPTIDDAVDHAWGQVVAAKTGDSLALGTLLLPSTEGISYVRRRLGDVLGVRLQTFYSLGQAILDENGSSARRIGDAAVRRLVRRILIQMAEEGLLTTFASVWQKPGFVQVLVDWLREMKSQGIDPLAVAAEADRSGRERDRQLARFYDRYQAYLQEKDYSDTEGLLWLAAEALENNPRLGSGSEPFLTLGFDQYSPIQLRLLDQLARRRPRLAVYLLWDPGRPEDSLALTRLRETRDELVRTLAGDSGQWVGNSGQGTVDSGQRPGVDPVLVHLRGSLFELGAEVKAAGDPSPVRAVAGPSREGEVRWALRAAKRLLLEGVPPEEIALLAPQPGVYRRLVETVAHEYGLPVHYERELTGNPAVGALLNLLALAGDDFPWRETFDALRSPYFRQPWLSPVQIGLLDQLTRERPVVAGREQWRFALQPLSLDGAEVDDEDLAGRPLVAQIPAQELAAVKDGLMAFFDHISPLTPATYREHALWLQEKILGLFDPDPEEAPVNLEMVARCQEEDEAWRDEAWRDVAALGEVTKAMGELIMAAGQVPMAGDRQIPWSVYLGELSGLLSVRRAPARPAQGALRFRPLEAGRATAVDYLFVLGLAEGEYPQPPPADPLYAPAERERQNRPGSLPLRYVDPAEAASLWWQVLSGARRQLVLSRPRLDESGAPWLPSPYWEAALATVSGIDVQEPPVAGTPDPEEAAGSGELLLALAGRGAQRAPAELQEAWSAAGQAQEVMAQRQSWRPPGKYEGMFQSPALAAELGRRYGLSHGWSASRLNRYGNCPYGYFAQYILDLEERPDPEEGFDPLQRGSLLHEVLELLYRRLAEEGLSPTEGDREAVLAHLKAVCDGLFPVAPNRYGFRPGPLWRYEQREMRRLLRAFVIWECEENGLEAHYRPFKQEMRFGIRGSERSRLGIEDESGIVFYLHGMIDRIDLDEKGQARVVDYKSGATGYSKNDVAAGVATQVALYALAAERLLAGVERVAESAYLHLPSRAASARLAFGSSVAEDTHVQGALASAAAFVRQTRAGLFPSAPAKPAAGGTACRTGCPYAALCRVSRLSIAKARRV